MRKINEIILHCSATKENNDIKAKTIAEWHKKRGFKDIGYHYVIDLDGTVEVGRPESQIGSHVSGHNSKTIGICYIGGLDMNMKPKDTRTEAQKLAMLGLVAGLLAKYPDINKITGHNKYANKACPCFDVNQWLDENGLGDYGDKNHNSQS